KSEEQPHGEMDHHCGHDEDRAEAENRADVDVALLVVHRRIVGRTVGSAAGNVELRHLLMSRPRRRTALDDAPERLIELRIVKRTTAAARFTRRRNQESDTGKVPDKMNRESEREKRAQRITNASMRWPRARKCAGTTIRSRSGRPLSHTSAATRKASADNP